LPPAIRGSAVVGEPDFFVDGLPCPDHTAARQLIRAGLLAPGAGRPGTGCQPSSPGPAARSSTPAELAPARPLIAAHRAIPGSALWEGMGLRWFVVVIIVTDQPAAVPQRETARGAGFARYVEPEIELLYRVAVTLTGQHADAEDLVQDTLIRAYRAVDRFDGAFPRAWLLTILRNTHRNRARARHPVVLRDDPQDSGLLDAPAGGPSTEDLVVGEQFDAAVVEAVRALADKHRAVVRLVDIDGLSYAEAAQALGIPRGTVMSRLHRARAQIRTRLVAAGLVPNRSRP
jgi:RNA polymerase sigma-70 factor (ECF subfamily)